MAIKQDVKVIFGGTFDPFHLGHLHIAKHVIKELALDNITLLPANIPPHKSEAKVTSGHRLAMLESVAKQEPLFTIDDRELHRDKPSYTVDTLREIKQQSPDTALNFVIGMDSLLNFSQWYQWQEILTLTNIIVCTRPHADIGKSYQTLDQRLHPFISPFDNFELTATSQISVLTPIEVDISSTQIRKALKEKSPKTLSLLPEPIRQYINLHKLYQ